MLVTFRVDTTASLSIEEAGGICEQFVTW